MIADTLSLALIRLVCPPPYLHCAPIVDSQLAIHSQHPNLRTSPPPSTMWPSAMHLEPLAGQQTLATSHTSSRHFTRVSVRFVFRQCRELCLTLPRLTRPISSLATLLHLNSHSDSSIWRQPHCALHRGRSQARSACGCSGSCKGTRRSRLAGCTRR